MADNELEENDEVTERNTRAMFMENINAELDYFDFEMPSCMCTFYVTI